MQFLGFKECFFFSRLPDFSSFVILIQRSLLLCVSIEGNTSFLVDWLFFVGKGSYLSTAWILACILSV